MLRSLFRSPRRPRRPGISAGTRLYAVGDIHGRADLLERLHRRIEDDAGDASKGTRKIVVYLGDFIDRGLDSKRVIELLLDQPLDGFDAIPLKGNHEDTLLRFLDDVSFGPAWLAIGGEATVMSYGARIPKGLSRGERFEHLQTELRARIPHSHRQFMERLELMYQAGDYVFVHAGIRPGVPLERQDPKDLLWIRDEFLSLPHGLDKVVVHGHSLREQPEIRDHRIGIDTGAYATNVLTCLVLEGTDRRFLSTAPANPG
jgi:serine/threonine protein phosphatase 1